MPLEKLASKRKRVTKGAVGALAAAGLTFGLAGGAYASTTPTADAPQNPLPSPTSSPIPILLLRSLGTRSPEIRPSASTRSSCS